MEQLSEISQMMQQKAVEAFIEKNFRKVILVTSMMNDVKACEERINFDTMRKLHDLDQAITILLIAREIRRIAGYSVAVADAAANRILSPQQLIMGSSHAENL